MRSIRQLPILAISILALPAALAAQSLEANVVEVRELAPAPASELHLDEARLEIREDGSTSVHGVFALPMFPSPAFYVIVSVDPKASTYTARMEIDQATPWTRESGEAGSNIVEDPGSGCPVQICHREAWVSGRNLMSSDGHVENITRVSVDYKYKLDTGLVTLLGYLQRCTKFGVWTIIDCAKYPVTFDFGSFDVSVYGRYRIFWYVNNHEYINYMNSYTRIGVYNGVQQLEFNWFVEGFLNGTFEQATWISPYDCRTVQQY